MSRATNQTEGADFIYVCGTPFIVTEDAAINVFELTGVSVNPPFIQSKSRLIEVSDKTAKLILASLKKNAYCE